MLTVRDNIIHADTKTLTATIRDGKLLQLTAKKSGKQYVDASGNDIPAMELVYTSGGYPVVDAIAKSSTAGKTEPVISGYNGSVEVSLICDTVAEVRIIGWNANGIIIIEEDECTGELLITPSAYSARDHLRSVKYNVSGISRDVDAIIPMYQGVRLKLDDPLIQNYRCPWPREWEAGFCIFQTGNDGFWVWTQDDHFRYKSIHLGAENESQCVGFEAETYGPSPANFSAGGLTWRVGVYEGDWRVPAGIYRDWLWRAYDLDKRNRPDWIRDITFCACWVPIEEEYLDLLATRVNPKRTLLHIPHWRRYKYDQQYPNYEASPEAKDFFTKAQRMGYKLAPHGNIFEIDPSEDIYNLLGQFEYRELETGQRLGWTISVDESGERAITRVPMSNSRLRNNRNCNTMVKIHPAQPMWHSILRENLQKAKRDYNLDCIFLDVSHNTFNLANCLVNNTTSTEGCKLLLDYLCRIDGGWAIGGEGLNEITMQSQTFAQIHLFRWFAQPKRGSLPGMDRTGGIDLGNFLYGKLCRSVGYGSLIGLTEDERLFMKLNEEHGVIPTITARNTGDIRDPNPAMLHLFELANSR